MLALEMPCSEDVTLSKALTEFFSFFPSVPNALLSQGMLTLGTPHSKDIILHEMLWPLWRTDST
jgi:hypothetical protein